MSYLIPNVPQIPSLPFTFNARFVEKELVEDYLDSGKAGVRNGLYFFLLDRDILRGMRLVGLDHEAVTLFHDTIRKQLRVDYDRVDYESCLGGLFVRTTRELFEMGRKFQHKCWAVTISK